MEYLIDKARIIRDIHSMDHPKVKMTANGFQIVLAEPLQGPPAIGIGISGVYAPYTRQRRRRPQDRISALQERLHLLLARRRR